MKIHFMTLIAVAFVSLLDGMMLMQVDEISCATGELTGYSSTFWVTVILIMMFALGYISGREE